MSDHQFPSGTVTFLFTDVEGSTRAWQAYPEQMRAWLAEHDSILSAVVSGHHGVLFKHTGDGVCAAFAVAGDAIAAALDAQQTFTSQPQTLPERARVRMALNSGTAHVQAGDYFGPPLNRCARILSLAAGGQVLCSQATGDLAREALPPEASLVDLGQHRLRDLPGLERLLEARFGPDQGSFPPLRSASAPPDRLPRPRTSFVGRREAVDELSGLLARERLVSLVGTGGAGKTRLALQVAAGVHASFAGGAFFVDLTASRDPVRVAAVTAEAVGAPTAAGRSPLQDVIAYLGTGSALLVVDNCEHVLDSAAGVLDTLLSACPQLVVLATSREPLRISGEHVWKVPSLGVALDGGGDAVALFVDRAKLVSATVQPEDLPLVGAICARLDGIPLAIELAAARTRHLTPREILERLGDRFALLSGGGRDADARHRTLRATLDWSHDLLGEREQALFRRLAVFAGDFALDAVEGVCAGDGIEPVEVLDLLASLVDRSLVVVAEGRYTLLETIREYAIARLEAAGETDRLCGRHCRWFAHASRHYASPASARGWLSSRTFVEVTDLSNLRTAIEWGLEHDLASARAIVTRVWLSFLYAGDWTSPKRWLAAVSGDIAGGEPAERASLMLGDTYIASLIGEMAAAFDLADEAVSFAQLEHLDAVVVAALATQGVAAQASGRGDPETLFRRAQAVAAQIPDTFAWSYVTELLGEYVLNQGRAAEADELLTEALAGLPGSDRLWALVASASAALILSDGERALSFAEDAIAYAPENDPFQRIYARLVYALAVAEVGDHAEARRVTDWSVRETTRFSVPLQLADALVVCGAVAHVGGDDLRAARLLGAARAEFGRNHSWRRPLGGALYLHYGKHVRLALEPEPHERARREGLSLSSEQAVELALDTSRS